MKPPHGWCALPTPLAVLLHDKWLACGRWAALQHVVGLFLSEEEEEKEEEEHDELRQMRSRRLAPDDRF